LIFGKKSADVNVKNAIDLSGRRGELSGVGFFREVFITVKRFGKRAILLLG